MIFYYWQCGLPRYDEKSFGEKVYILAKDVNKKEHYQIHVGLKKAYFWCTQNSGSFFFKCLDFFLQTFIFYPLKKALSLHYKPR